MGINALSFIFFKKNIAAMKIKIKNKIVKLNAFQKPTVPGTLAGPMLKSDWIGMGRKLQTSTQTRT